MEMESWEVGVWGPVWVCLVWTARLCWLDLAVSGKSQDCRPPCDWHWSPEFDSLLAEEVLGWWRLVQWAVSGWWRFALT